MKKLTLTTIAVFWTASTVAMSDLERMTLANQIGTILAAEKICDLEYDGDALDAWLESKVSADDMQFTPLLTSMVNGTIYGAEDHTKSTRRLFCRQARRNAKAFGFIID